MLVQLNDGIVLGISKAFIYLCVSGLRVPMPKAWKQGKTEYNDCR